MILQYKTDWEEAKNFFKSWWASENERRCGLWATAPRDGFRDLENSKPIRKKSAKDAWRDLVYYRAMSEINNKGTFFGGEAFPQWSSRYSMHKQLGAFLGSEVDFAKTTVWLHPLWTGDTFDYDSLVIDEHNEHYQFAVAEQKAAIDYCKNGKALAPVVTNLSGCGDILAQLRGTEQLLFDVMDRPDEVRLADQALMDKLLEELSAKGLFIVTSCDSEAHARELLKNAENWSRF